MSILAKLARIEVVSWEWNDRSAEVGQTPNTRAIGVVSQQLATVFPELVVEKAGYLGVDYGGLAAVVLKGLQELVDRVGCVESGQQELVDRIDRFDRVESAHQDLVDRVAAIESVQAALAGRVEALEKRAAIDDTRMEPDAARATEVDAS